MGLLLRYLAGSLLQMVMDPDAPVLPTSTPAFPKKTENIDPGGARSGGGGDPGSQ
jgi:hypothetical protein